MHNFPTYDGNDERAVVADEQNQQGFGPCCNLVQGDVLLRRRCVWQLRTEQRVVGHASSGSRRMTVLHGIGFQQISFGILPVVCIFMRPENICRRTLKSGAADPSSDCWLSMRAILTG